ncbi:MAG TPA: hypothetical protein VEI26_08785 [Terriglobales bacterium]|nr:hypothetical protein [Terriglobales bacterium]
MKAPAQILLCSVSLVCIFLVTTDGQTRREPLNPVEIDKLRDAAQEPEARIKLFVQFARGRLASLEQVRADANVADRAQQTHDKLQNFLDVYDELNDNIDTFVDRKADLRKPLKAVIEADTEFQAKLRALKSSVGGGSEEAQKYQFLLDSAVDAVDGGAQDHRKLLSEQEEEFKHRKKQTQQSQTVSGLQPTH